MKQFWPFLLCSLVLNLTGCGYSLVGQGNLPKHIKTIAVPIFANKTLEKGIEDQLTQAIIAAFVKGGKLKLVAENEADALLTGTIRAYKADEAVAYNDLNQISKYRLTVTVDINLQDLTRDETLWKTENLAEAADFEGGQDINLAQEQENKETALQTVAEKLADRILALSLEGF
jgi:outer membrane lipopolysaccharide assembly protein LptE/RlpB